MPSSAAARPPPTTVAVLGALGDRTRMAIVGELSQHGPRSVTLLAQEVGGSRQAVTKHLTVLERAGVVRSQRVGRTRVYRLEPARVGSAVDDLAKLSSQWEGTLRRLQKYVERSPPRRH
jgi:DNA-binding transcriptional ArsR family regulator